MSDGRDFGAVRARAGEWPDPRRRLATGNDAGGLRHGGRAFAHRVCARPCTGAGRRNPLLGTRWLLRRIHAGRSIGITVAGSINARVRRRARAMGVAAGFVRCCQASIEPAACRCLSCLVITETSCAALPAVCGIVRGFVPGASLQPPGCKVNIVDSSSITGCRGAAPTRSRPEQAQVRRGSNDLPPGAVGGPSQKTRRPPARVDSIGKCHWLAHEQRPTRHGRAGCRTCSRAPASPGSPSAWLRPGPRGCIDVLVLRPAVGELLPESRVEWRIGGRFVIKHQFAGA